MDGMMEEYMNRLQIPGAVISIVKDGKIIFGQRVWQFQSGASGSG
ncbi:hypothetical protein ACFTAO_12100 [Paenibacillus rhizoplanae]